VGPSVQPSINLSARPVPDLWSHSAYPTLDAPETDVDSLATIQSLYLVTKMAVKFWVSYFTPLKSETEVQLRHLSSLQFMTHTYFEVLRSEVAQVAVTAKQLTSAMKTHGGVKAGRGVARVVALANGVPFQVRSWGEARVPAAPSATSGLLNCLWPSPAQ
jgi:hypothetical protein